MTQELIPALVRCVTCTREVPADAEVEADYQYRKAKLVTVPGQKCPRCAASLDSAVVVERRDN
jgi:hypothetical protein